MKPRQKIITFALAVLPLLVGCTAYQPDNPENSMSSEISGEVSAAPFDPASNTADPATPNLQYLGSHDPLKTDAYKLYIKNYTVESSESVIEWEHVTESRLADRLSERISSDLSPDLCDKIDNSLPYLSKKNLYEDLTDYIDITAPQWAPYADYITGSGGARYFYPTNIAVSPYVLLYSRKGISALGGSDPLTLLRSGEWTINTLKSAVNNKSSMIGGRMIAENFLASYGTELFSIDESGKITSGLHSEKFTEAAAFIAANYAASDPSRSSDLLKNDIETLQSGGYAFLSITEDDLKYIRREYPAGDLEIVPFPRSDDAQMQYYYAVSEGYLVPKRAKNIRGAASFINCARIAAYSDETRYDGLSEQDKQTLSEIHSAKLSQLVFDNNYCLDDDANSATREIISAIYSNGKTVPLDEYIKSVEAPILKSIEEINRNTE